MKRSRLRGRCALPVQVSLVAVLTGCLVEPAPAANSALYRASATAFPTQDYEAPAATPSRSALGASGAASVAPVVPITSVPSSSDRSAGAPASAGSATAGASAGPGTAGVHGAGGSPAPVSEIPPAATAQPSQGVLTISFTTANQGKRYSPQNVGAIWIETNAGGFVRTLERWASSRARYLQKWTAASGGWSARGGRSADQMDAVSRATLRTEQKHQAMWNMQDPMGQLVPDGSYRVAIEVTEIDGAGPVEYVSFDKGPNPVQLSPPDTLPYSGLMLNYQPQ